MNVLEKLKDDVTKAGFIAVKEDIYKVSPFYVAVFAIIDWP